MAFQPTLHRDESSLKIAGENATLEAVIAQPKGEEQQSLWVLCHPHPLHGGTMHNKVVTTFARTLRMAGKSSLRFNYRGIGQSTGEYQQISDALEDATIIANWASKEGYRIVGWMGFSFGAYIASHMAIMQQSPQGALLVAPSINNMPYETLTPKSTIPWLIIQGDDDEVVLPQATYNWASQYPFMALIKHPKVGHFFHGHLALIEQGVATFIEGK